MAFSIADTARFSVYKNLVWFRFILYRKPVFLVELAKNDIFQSVVYWGYKRKPGRPRKNWVDVIKRDLRQMDLTWVEAEELANDKSEWHRRVAQCSHLDVGWTKV